MKTSSLRSTLTLVIAAGFAGFSTAAVAGDIRFSFKASELSDPEALYARMADRAKAACGSAGYQSLAARAAAKKCADALLDDFVAATGNPKLTAVHDQSVSGRLADLL